MLVRSSVIVPCLEFPGASGQITKKPSLRNPLMKQLGQDHQIVSSLSQTDLRSRCVVIKLTGNFFVPVTGPGRTSPYLRTSAKMKPIEESVEDDVFEAPSADKLELQRLP